MKPFMDEDFILENDTAKRLFHEYAENMPVIDYHCHISPKDIYEDRRFDNLAEVWLGGRQPDGSCFGDHYKWRVMRSNGVSEDYITGEKPAYERYLKFIEALEMAIGNPMVHWCNLELRQFFGYDKPLTLENLSRYAQMSESSFRHQFKAATGLAPIDYLIRLRCRRAMLDMFSSNHTISEIALESGFSDGNYFARKFREVTGRSPREFRRGCRSGEIEMSAELSRILQP